MTKQVYRANPGRPRDKTLRPDRMTQPAPIVVLFTGHVGSTWLASSLGSHPAIRRLGFEPVDDLSEVRIDAATYINDIFREAASPVSEATSKRILSLPMHPYLSDSNVEHIAAVVEAFSVQRGASVVNQP